MTEEKNELVFVSRHAPNNGQVALAQKMGYSSIKQINVVFNTNPLDPVKDLKEAGIHEKKISIVAPSYITNYLLNCGYTLIDFIPSIVKREKMVFCCEGAYVYRLPEYTEALGKEMEHISKIVGQGLVFPSLPNRVFGRIEQEYIKCPISIEDQVESSLI